MNTMKRQKIRTLKDVLIQETGIKTIPKKKKCKREKRLPEEALQIAVNRREVKGKGEKGKIYPFKCRVPKNSKER